MRPESAVVLRYGAAVILVAAALGTALVPTPREFAASVHLVLFCGNCHHFLVCRNRAGSARALLSYLALSDLFVPVKILGSSSESYLVIYGIFGAAVSWFSASRRRAERLLTEAREIWKCGSRSEQGNLRGQRTSCRASKPNCGSEKDRLKLLLDLNNSMVSKLELRELLRDISASVRRLMQCDAVGVNLPDPETGELKLFALDFPAAKGFLREEMVRPSGSLACASAFSTGRAGDIQSSGMDVPTVEDATSKRKVCNPPAGCP